MTYPHVEASIDALSEQSMGKFNNYVKTLPPRRKSIPGGSEWHHTQISPCPLLARCSACKQYLPQVDYYITSIKNRRKDILGNLRVSRCPACNMEAYFALDPRVKLLNSARQRASIKGLEFSITVDDIKIPKFCPVLGIELRASERAGTLPINKLQASPTIERIDNRLGYTPQNICVISHRANRLKCNGTLQELKAIVEFTERMMRECGLGLAEVETSNTNHPREVMP